MSKYQKKKHEREEMRGAKGLLVADLLDSMGRRGVGRALQIFHGKERNLYHSTRELLISGGGRWGSRENIDEYRRP